VLKILSIVAVVSALAGCSVLGQDRRDAPWDPKPGRTLFDQIPNEDGGANRVCCGHLRVCKPHQTPRC
jgi:hypothetical protein